MVRLLPAPRAGLATVSGGRVYLPQGKLYFVDRTPNSKHYGCLKFAPYSHVLAST